MKTLTKNIKKKDIKSNVKVNVQRKYLLSWIASFALMVITLLSSKTELHAQVSGNWDSYATDGTAGYSNLGGGVITLLSDGTNTCAAAAVHETTNRYNTSSATSFSKCYQVFFGCPGNDNIGSDVNGDGVAFSFWPSTSTYNVNNGLACGGGLGYMGAVGGPSATTKMITIEFDTYSSPFDGVYGGGTTGNNDEISLHKDGDAGTSGLITPGVNAGNLEDGLEHTICISYNPTTKVLSVSIDGVTRFSYTYDLAAYFGAGVLLNQTWSSGKYGATNPTTVSDETGTAGTIASRWGAPFCPATVVITSPLNGEVFGNGCSVGPVTITADAFPPAGNTVTRVDFFLDGSATPFASDNTAPYSATYTSPTVGSHTVTARAYWSGGSSSTTTDITNFTVAGAIQKTSTVPTISNGIIDAIWNTYPATILSKGNGASGNDLSASYKVMWDNTHLYVLVDVTDDIANTTGAANWEKDGVEIYIDLGDNGTGAYGTDDNQYTFVYGSTTVNALLRSPASTAGVTFEKVNKTTPTGYMMEISFPWTALGGSAPAPGTPLGFDVSINDDDNGGTRDNQLSWNDGTYGEWNNTSLFGTLNFSSCDPLPISLLFFNGELINHMVELRWSTILEINNGKFIIERSTDLSHWEPIGELAGAGNYNSIRNYNFTDESPLGGISYYRLKQIDYDGLFSYSNLVVIDKKQHHLSIYPNPFEDTFVIKSNYDTEMEISNYRYYSLVRCSHRATRKWACGS